QLKWFLGRFENLVFIGFSCKDNPANRNGGAGMDTCSAVAVWALREKKLQTREIVPPWEESSKLLGNMVPLLFRSTPP
ncbi:MAG TPA: hypothetical protein VI386_31675, partial [Candidatus Sulfotelmatobacter sp.]